MEPPSPMSDRERAEGSGRLPTDLSVSIVNANSRDALLECLKSMEGGLTDEVDMEIVVLDNASDDGSADAVRKCFPQVRLIEQGFREGFGVNHNRVIRATTSRYVYLVNPDTLSDDWGFARLVAELDGHPRVAALGPQVVYPNGVHQESAWRFPTPFASLLGLATLGRVGSEQSVGELARRVDWLMGSALVLRREADDVGLFDESFFMYFEETDLCLRLRKAGWELRYFPALTVVHQKAESTADSPERRINEWWRGHHRYWRKHHSSMGARVAATAMGARYAGAALLVAAIRPTELVCGSTLGTRCVWSGPVSASSPTSGTAPHDSNARMESDPRHSPELTISIVNTNNRELLLACLESLRRTRYRRRRAGDRRAQRFGGRLCGCGAEPFPGVRVLEQRFRSGFGANHNTVIRETRGRYVYVLNEDTASEDWGFARLVAEMDSRPRVAALGPRLVYPDGRRQDSAWRFPSPIVSVVGLPTLGRVGIVQSRGSRSRAVDWLMGSALLLRREALEEVGLFDESFFIYFEEVDLCRRLHRAGWELSYFPDVTVVHYESQFSADVPDRRINEMWRGRHRYWHKHHSALRRASRRARDRSTVRGCRLGWSCVA